MRRRERERILRQGVVLPETPRDRRNLEALEADMRDSPLRGRELALRLRNFRPDAGSYLASLGGPLPYMGRLRDIDALTVEHEQRLASAYETLGADPEAWQALALQVGLRRGERADRAAQPVVPGRVAAADGSADWRLRARQRTELPSPATGRVVGARAVPVAASVSRQSVAASA